MSTELVVHYLKCHQESFVSLATEKKTFEIRLNDRKPGYAIGHILYLHEIRSLDIEGESIYTGKELMAQVYHILEGGMAEKYGLQPGYCVMNVQVIPQLAFSYYTQEIIKLSDNLGSIFLDNPGEAIIRQLTDNWTHEDWFDWSEPPWNKVGLNTIGSVKHYWIIQAEKWYTEKGIKETGMSVFEQSREFEKWFKW